MYRYGFNGMEKDDEIKGSGNSYDYGARMYDSRIGRWLAVDPLAGKFPSESPYIYAGNSPIAFVDPNGEEPRWGQLANLTEILGEVQLALSNFKDVSYRWYYNLVKGQSDRQINASKQFDILRDHFEHNTRYTRENGELKQSNGNVDRYLYTTDKGWIDMHHFFYFAQKGATFEEHPIDVWAMSYGSEIIQSSQDNPSGFSYEDLISNELGYQFGQEFGMGKYGDMTIEEALTEFLNGIGATEPEEAPNFDVIPHIANENVPQKMDGNPLKDGELKEAHEAVDW